MFNIFKRSAKKGNGKKLPSLKDLDDNPLKEGDIVDALRYDLGKSRIILIEEEYHYESIQTGEKVSWIRMIDAITQNQKVKKVSE